MGTDSDLLVWPGESVGTTDAAHGWKKNGNHLSSVERERERERERE